VIERTAQLEEMNRELESFSYSVSHDLRAPLRHINGFSDLLANETKGLLSEKAIHYLETINNSARNMGRLIDELLDFSRTGRIQLNRTRLNMNNLLEDTRLILQPFIGNRSIQWVIADLPMVSADLNLLKLVWMNLIENALKYSSKRELSIINVYSIENNDEYIFSVNDNGVGFDMKYVHKLFGVFQRLHTLADFDGTGIGLANVRRIITKHGGRVWAEAEIEKGATFYFTIPKNID
jgi:light-regulated signal transduction histidine kinase (bacteriophytochrome)